VHRISTALSVLLMAWPAWAGAQNWTVDRDASVFAVVTHKEGLAAGLAHEHLVVASDYDVTLGAADDSPQSFRMELSAEHLIVDDPNLASKWQPRLLDLEVIGEPFAELSDKDRGKIQKSMLGKKQLDAESHPEIQSELQQIRTREGGGYLGTLTLTVKGQTASREIEFDWPAAADGPIRIEVVTTFTFSELGIEPYSAMLGSIRVADTFHVFVVVSIDRS